MNLRVPTPSAASVAGAVGVWLHFAPEAFVPVALAFLFSLALSSPVEALHGLGVRRSPNATLLLGAVIAVGNLISEPAQAGFNTAAHAIKLIERKIRPVAQSVAKADSVRKSAGNIGRCRRRPGNARAGHAEGDCRPLTRWTSIA